MRRAAVVPKELNSSPQGSLINSEWDTESRGGDGASETLGSWLATTVAYITDSWLSDSPVSDHLSTTLQTPALGQSAGGVISKWNIPTNHQQQQPVTHGTKSPHSHEPYDGSRLQNVIARSVDYQNISQDHSAAGSKLLQDVLNITITTDTASLASNAYTDTTAGNGSFVNGSEYMEGMRDTFEDNITLNMTMDFDGYPYPSMYPWWHIIIASIVVTAIMLIIVIGNALVVIAIARDRQLKGLQNWFIASLAVSDLFVGLLIMPLSLANELMGYWYFGTVLCELWLATDVLLCTASILNLCLISLDRYWSITRAISYVKQRTKKRAAIMITLVWLLSMILCFPPLAGWKRPQPSIHGLPLCVLSEEPGYVVYSTVGSFYIPLIVMILVYFKIFLAARARARRNLKKPVHLPPNNGKSTSTTTTTSFSNPSRQLDDHTGRLSPTMEINSDDDISQMDLTMPDSTMLPDTEATSCVETTTDPEGGGGLKMRSVANHGAKFLSVDENKKLLSDDTDSACESTPAQQPPTTGGDGGNGGGNSKPRHIHFSEETDSLSDSTSSKHTGLTDRSHQYAQVRGGGKSSAEENLKPLLEDSQVESDSQRDSDHHNVGRFAAGQDSHLPKVQITMPGCEEGSARKKKRHRNKQNGASGGDNASTKKNLLSPAYLGHLGSNFVYRGAHPKAKKQHHHHHLNKAKDDPERQKRKIARAKERRATIVLGIIMATFIGCWLPFFSIYLIASLAKVHIPSPVFAIIFWLGYVNSALNPIIYTIFNQDFRRAFKKIIFDRRRSTF